MKKLLACLLLVSLLLSLFCGCSESTDKEEGKDTRASKNFLLYGENDTVTFMDLDTGKTQSIPLDVMPHSARISQNNKRLVMSADGCLYYVLLGQDTPPKQLTNSLPNGTSFDAYQLSRDGKVVAYTNEDMDGHLSLLRYDSDRDESTLLSDNIKIYTMSDDGQRIFFTEQLWRRGKSYLSVYYAEAGKDPVLVGKYLTSDTSISFHPPVVVDNCSALVYIDRTENLDGNKVYIWHADTGNAEELFSANQIIPITSREIYYISPHTDAQSGGNLYYYNGKESILIQENVRYSDRLGLNYIYYSATEGADPTSLESCYIVYKGTVTKIGDLSHQLKPDGRTILHYDEETETLSYYFSGDNGNELRQLTPLGNKIKVTTGNTNNVLLNKWMPPCLTGDVLWHFKEGQEGLYRDDKLIDEKAEVFSAVNEHTAAYWSKGTLYLWKNGKVTQVAEDVEDYLLTENGSLLYSRERELLSNTGQLYFVKDGKTEQLSDSHTQFALVYNWDKSSIYSFYNVGRFVSPN